MRRYARMIFENDRRSACTHLFFQHNRLLPLQFSFLGNHKRILVVIFLSFVNYRSSKKQLTKLPRREYVRTGQNNETIGRKKKKDKMTETGGEKTEETQNVWSFNEQKGNSYGQIVNDKQHPALRTTFRADETPISCHELTITGFWNFLQIFSNTLK